LDDSNAQSLKGALFCEPRSRLARMLSSLTGGSVLIALKSYFDGSLRGSKWTDCDAIALAGFAAGDDVIAQFEKDYKAVLKDDRFRPAAPYLHMSKLRSESSDSPFSRAKGWDDSRRTRLVNDVVDYLGSLDKTKSRLFVCSVEPKAIERLRGEDANAPSPIRICNHYVPHWVMAWHARHFPGLITDSHYFFDWNEPFKHDFERLRRIQTGDRFETSGNRETWMLIKSIVATDAQTETPLQIADLLAWGTIRQRTNNQNPFLIGIAVAVKKILPSSWLHVTDVNAADSCANVPRDPVANV
jgi:hypothetical protein